MALSGVICSSCGLVILSDQKAEYVRESNDFYHSEPYPCYTYRNIGVF